MKELQYTTVDRIISKFYRDLKGSNLNETDAIEWIGEALDFLRVSQVQEEAVSFIEVSNYQVDFPKNLYMILQVAKYNGDKPREKICPNDVSEELPNDVKTDLCGEGEDDDIIIDKQTTTTTAEQKEKDCEERKKYPNALNYDGSPLTGGEFNNYNPFFTFSYKYFKWNNSTYFRDNFTPVRLSNNIFFNSIVCREKETGIYSSCIDEYTVVGTMEKKIRLSFKDGTIAVSYLKSVTDEETGFPLVPDQVSYITAITYYVKWKIAEMYSWNGREGYRTIALDQERKWLKYAKQAKNFLKMPKSIDQYQNLLEQTHYLIPRDKRYYGYFGNLGKEEGRKFNNPDYRNQSYYR